MRSNFETSGGHGQKLRAGEDGQLSETTKKKGSHLGREGKKGCYNFQSLYVRAKQESRVEKRGGSEKTVWGNKWKKPPVNVPMEGGGNEE